MRSTYVPLTVHDYPHRASFNEIFSQIADHEPTPETVNVPYESLRIETVPAAHFRLTLHLRSLAWRCIQVRTKPGNSQPICKH